MSEAIKIEVGQVWEVSGETLTIYSVEAGRANLCRNGIVEPNGFVHSGDDCCWRPKDYFTNSGKLISPAPAKVEANRSGCHWSCGMTGRAVSLDSRSFGDFNRWIRAKDYKSSDDDGSAQLWCTDACVSERRPPMGETNVLGTHMSPTIENSAQNRQAPKDFCKFCGCGDGPGDFAHLPSCKRAKPETTKVPKCGWSGANHTGAVLLRVARTGEVVTVCDGCWLSNEAVIADNVGGGIAPYTGPERLEKPKMAGDSWWLDSAEDVR